MSKNKMKSLFYKFNLLIVDFIVFLVSNIILNGLFMIFTGDYKNILEVSNVDTLILFFIIIFSFFIREGLYTFKPYFFLEEIKRIVSSVVYAEIIMLFAYFLLKLQDSTFIIVCSFIVFIPLSIYFRYYYRTFAVKLKLIKYNAIVLGSGFQGIELASIIKKDLFLGYDFIGYVDNEKTDIDGQKVIGHMNEIDDLIKKYEISEIIVGVPKVSRKELDDIVLSLEGKVEHITFIPDMYGIMTYKTEINDYNRLLTIRAVQNIMIPFKNFVKRIFDIVLSLMGFILFVPITLIVFVFIKLEGKGRGKVFFRQTRIGKDGKDIVIWKYRTMFENAEEILKELLARDPSIKEEYYSNYFIKNDPRITKLGKIIRKSGMDDLPQIINVLKGEMSFVGPRPYRKMDVDDIGGKYQSIIRVKPGMISMANTLSDDIKFSERVLLDQYYIRNWSLWLDISIVIRMIASILKS